MKRFLILLSLLFCNVVFADTINLHWLNEDGSIYQNSTCVIDSDLILPATPPTKYGYTFTGWKMVNYVPIEYLESTGTQWIDTGVVATEYTRTIAKLYTTEPENKNWFGSAGNLNSYGNYTFNSFSASSIEYIFGGTNHWEKVEVPYVVGFPFEVDFSKNGIIINGITVSRPSYSSFSISNLSITLFVRNGGAACIRGRIYFLQIYDNDVLVRDFIPVLDYNGIPCMYDKVTGQFFYNQGTGQFVAGPVLQ